MKVCTYCQVDYQPDKRNYKTQRYCSRQCYIKHYKILNAEHIQKVAQRRYDRMKADPELWEKHKAMGRKHRANWKGRMAKYKRQAKERGHKFLLSRDEFKSFWGAECYYCGITVKGIGIDRLDSRKGYTMSNCVPSCTKCNKMKNSLSYKKFLDKCEKILKQSKICEEILKRHGKVSKPST